MIRSILSSAIAVHGLIHLMGFAKEWNLGPDGSFSGQTLIELPANTSKFVGVLWLIACLLLLTSAFTYYRHQDWFGIVGVCAIVISQALIIVYWPTAKWGTIVNVMLLLMIFLTAGRVSFEHMVKEEVSNLFSASSNNKYIVSEEKISMLPGLVQRWIRRSNVTGQTIPAGIYVRQKGMMRSDTSSGWMPFEAEQYFTIDPPGFIWNATIRSNRFINISGRDKFNNGKGNMLIKAGSLITLANSSGIEIDQGTMIRYMAEMIWFPQAALSHYLRWEEIDDSRARVTMSYKGVTASGVFTFNENSLPSRFEAQRYGEFNGKYSKEMWLVHTTGYGNFEGLQLANASEVTWKLQDGDFTWLRLEVEDIAFLQKADLNFKSSFLKNISRPKANK